MKVKVSDPHLTNALTLKLVQSTTAIHNDLVQRLMDSLLARIQECRSGNNGQFKC